MEDTITRRNGPTGPTSREVLLGSPFSDTDLNAQWRERGSITDVHPERLSCDVETETRGRLLGLALPYLIQDPEGGGGQVYVPRVNQKVIVSKGLGRTIITDVLPVSVSVADDAARAAVASGAPSATGAAAASTSGGAANYAGRLPKDLLPGDFIQIGNQGQYHGVFDGGVVSMQAAPWSQVVCSQEDDTTVVAGRNMKLLSGFGNVRFTSSGGKHGFVFEGGTDQLTETDEENWAVQFRVGEEAEGLMDFRLNNRAGETVAKKVWFADGSTSARQNGIADTSFSQSVLHQYGANFSERVVGGSTLSVGADRLETIQGSQKTTVSQNRSAIVMQDRFDTMNRDWTVSAGRNMGLTVGGDQQALPGAVAAGWNITNGSWVVDVGFGGAGDLGSAMSGIEFNVHAPGGGIVMSSATDKIALNTAIPESVLLGANQGIAKFHAVLWEQLKSFIDSLVLWLDAHQHPTGMGPSGPPMPPNSSVNLKALIPPIQSRIVMLGG